VPKYATRKNVIAAMRRKTPTPYARKMTAVATQSVHSAPASTRRRPLASIPVNPSPKRCTRRHPGQFMLIVSR
jgi:hypothetical protein